MSLPRFSPKRLKEIADGKRNADGTKKRTGLTGLKKNGLVSKASSFTQKPRKALKPRSPKNKGGQRVLFERIWNTREHKCEVCGAHIEEATASNFHHLLNKGHFPEYKLDERNISLLCSGCHEQWHSFGQRVVSLSPQWKKVHAQFLALREEAYGLTQKL